MRSRSRQSARWLLRAIPPFRQSPGNRRRDEKGDADSHQNERRNVEAGIACRECGSEKRETDERANQRAGEPSQHPISRHSSGLFEELSACRRLEKLGELTGRAESLDHL